MQETVVGHGLDLIDTRRVEDLMVEHGDRFLHRVFTPTEIEYCSPKGRRIEHFAGRFAAKEAVLKVLGTGWRGQLSFTDIEIRNNGMGAPEVFLFHEAARVAAEQGITRILVSITHLRDLAAASAIGIKG